MARLIWQQQMVHGWPGLGREVADICQTVGVEDANKTSMNEKEFMTVFDEASRGWEVARLKEEMVGSKAKVIVMEDCDMKPYMRRKSIKEVRDIYAERNFLLPFAGNYSNDKKYGDGLCRACAEGMTETQEHVRDDCPGYADLRTLHDMETEEGRMSFFRLVINRRNKSKDA